MLRNLVKAFISQEDLNQILENENFNIRDIVDGIKIKFNNKKYTIDVQVAKVNEKNWIDITLNVSKCSEPQCIREALEYAAKISSHIENEIFNILIYNNRSYLKFLSNILSNISINFGPIQLNNIVRTQINEAKRTRHSMKEKPGILTARIGFFTKIIVNFNLNK